MDIRTGCCRAEMAGGVGDEMSMILKMYAEPGLLHVDATGRFSLVEAKRTFIEMLEAVARNKVGKVLVDGRGLVGQPQVMERFFYGEFAAQSVAQFGARGVPPDTEFAYVLKVPVLDPGRFGELVALNRGMNVKTFEHLRDAHIWLGKTPANNPQASDGK
jgi:hypothetical protein